MRLCLLGVAILFQRAMCSHACSAAFHPSTALTLVHLLHIFADDLIAFLRRSAAALKPGGVLFVKENVCERGFIVDNSDASVTRQGPLQLDACMLLPLVIGTSCRCRAMEARKVVLMPLAGQVRCRHAIKHSAVPSVCRSHAYYTQLFDKAGMRLTHTALQQDFPRSLFKVRMYALLPKQP